jgi:stress-induced morphogen
MYCKKKTEALLVTSKESGVYVNDRNLSVSHNQNSEQNFDIKIVEKSFENVS